MALQAPLSYGGGLRAGNSDTGIARILACRISARLCALPLSAVIETMRPLPLEPLAGVPSAVLGAAIIRGVPTPVVDARRLLGGAAADPPARFVTIRAGATIVALAVDHVVGVLDVDRAALHALPALLSDAAAGAIAAIGRLDAELLLVLEAARLVPAELLAGAGAAP